MFCSKCGSEVKSGTKFCPNCGGEVKPTNNTVSSVVVPEKKKSHAWIWILVGVFVFLILAGIGVVVAIMLLIPSTKTSTAVVTPEEYKLVCEAKEGDITLTFTDDEITGYDARDITYDMDKQAELFKQYGKTVYMDTFNQWFEDNTSGSCIMKDSDGSTIKDYSKNKSNTNNNNNNKKSNTNKTTSDTKVVGQDKYGYVDVPSDWVNFKDPDAQHSIQFSKGISYIVTLDYIDPSEYPTEMDAKKLAGVLLTQSKEDSNISGVTGATVTIGKDKKYTAYQVYMYYIQENSYLVTYWFDGDDGYIHYLAIEGPDGIADYLSIPESWRATK